MILINKMSLVRSGVTPPVRERVREGGFTGRRYPGGLERVLGTGRVAGSTTRCYSLSLSLLSLS